MGGGEERRGGEKKDLVDRKEKDGRGEERRGEEKGGTENKGGK